MTSPVRGTTGGGIRSLGRSLVTMASAIALMASGLLSMTAQAATIPNVPKTYSSALSPADIARLSANPTDRVIVLLRNQHPEVPGKAGQKAARAATLANDQAHLTNELSALHAPNVHAYNFVNAVSATVSKDEADRLATDPTVLAVVPDATVQGPSKAASAASIAAASPRSPLSLSAPVTPAPGVCPSNPLKPILEPEALQLMNVDFGTGSTKPAAHDLATGKGVKIAVFPDGLDPNIPDFLRSNGKSAIFDYQDFSGEGLSAVTGGGEAFGDASSLISQGTQTYDLSGEVNPAHPLPVGCNIQIKGVAPDASVAVMKVFGNANLAFNSLVLQGIEWAVAVDGVDILSQSFGGNPVPNAGTDPIAVFDQDAVAAGVTVVVSSGDAGTTSTIGTPATTPGVISTGATTSYRLYAQTSSYGYQLGGKGFDSSNVSAFSSSGFTEYGPRTIDVLAPGESGWSDCSAVKDIAIFTNCADIYHGSKPQPIEAFGGTSESCPLTAGTAALVIQAYRDTHDGASPSPDLVKSIIMSTSQDLKIPSDNQGAGLVDALRAVQLARSIHDENGNPKATGQTLLYSPTSLIKTALPGKTSTSLVKVQNNGTRTEQVTPALRVLGPATTLADATLTLNPATDGTFVYQTGATVHDVQKVTFTVLVGTDRLVSRIAWMGQDSVPGGRTIRASLFDPSGRMAAQSRPQGAGGGFGEDEIANPAIGVWTLVVFDATAVPYSGPLHYTITGAKFQNVPNAVSPASASILPGHSASFAVKLTTPAAPGDLAEAVTFQTSFNTDLRSVQEADNSGNGQQPAPASIPVTLRSLIPVSRTTGGVFNGTLTGGNARMFFYGQELVYQFDVPAGIRNLDVNVAVGAPGYQIFGFLADPNISPADVQGSSLQDGSGTNLQTMHLGWVNPVKGRWNLDLTTFLGNQSLLTSVPITGTIKFDQPTVTSTGVPNSRGTVLAKGAKRTATVHIVNSGNSPAFYSIDPRLNQTSVLSLNSLTETAGALPIADFNFPQFVVPPFSTRLEMAAESTVPINFDTSPNFGTPDILSVQHGTNAVVSYSAFDIPASLWSCAPTEIGPGPATNTTFACGADALTNTFDPGVASSTGNIWSALEGLTFSYAPLELMPGQAGDITVTFTSSGNPGDVVAGFLAVETFNFNTWSSDQVARISYSYKLGEDAGQSDGTGNNGGTTGTP
jgi:hypothetical protein